MVPCARRSVSRETGRRFSLGTGSVGSIRGRSSVPRPVSPEAGYVPVYIFHIAGKRAGGPEVYEGSTHEDERKCRINH